MPSIILSDNGVSSGSAGLKSTAASDGALALQTTTSGGTATTAVTIDTSQNMGLGVTPSAWLSSTVATQIGNYGSVYAFKNSGNVYLNNNTYVNSGGSDVYLNTAPAGRYRISDNTHIWYNAPSGTAGTTATLTQAMTLDASGNLGIGTTSPGSILETKAVSPYIRSTTSNTAGNTHGLEFYETTSRRGFVEMDNSAGVLKVGTIPAWATIFYTNNTERARIDSSGRLLVNTTSGTTNALFQVSSNGTKQSFQVFNNDNVQLYSLGTGTVYSNGGVFTNTNPSDERLKDEITDLSFGLQQILALRPVSYKWKNDRVSQGTQYGFIAQEVQTVMPELVREFETTDGEETVTRFGLEKEGIYAALVKAIQELKAELDTAKEQIAILQGAQQ